MPTTAHYHPVAITLHWLTALAILAMFALGWTMVDLRPGSTLQFELFQWHKSVGFTILALTTLRLGWRVSHRPPPLPATMAEWEKRSAHLGHLALYALMIALPLTGWALVSTARFNIPTLLYGVVPIPHLGPLAELPNKAAAHEFSEQLHMIGTWLLAAILMVHVGAALRHHFLQRDDVLRRMLPKMMIALAVTTALGWTAPADAAEWLIDAAHSRLGFSGNQGGTAFAGSFARWQGGIDFDPARPAAGHALITIEMASAATGDAEKDQLLPQPEWFDIKSFPKAVFEATSFRAKGGTSYEAVGSLTIRGISRPVVLPFTLDLAGDRAHATGTLDLVRTDFGIGQGMWSTPQTVALQVAVTLDLAAQRR